MIQKTAKADVILKGPNDPEDGEGRRYFKRA